MRRALAQILVLAGLATGAAAPAEDEAAARLRSLAGGPDSAEPILRVGLAHAHRVTLSADGEFRVIDPVSGKPLWRPGLRGEIQVVAEGGPREGVSSVFRVQVGAFRERAAAEQEIERLSRLTGAAGVVHHDPDRGNWRVRLGRAEDRLALGPLMDELREAGVRGMWIAEEPAEAAGDVTLRLVDESYESFPTGLTRVAVVPASAGRVAVQGRSYRGVVELRVSPFGTVRPINWVGVERYLLGVVPAELGPEVWPELAALRAQAVAARTYAWRNRGQFGDEGFDICDSPRCQVYSGADAEHPLSDRAVWSTRGEILTWKGEPITALYTATCGGHTEDGKEIFPEHDEPYLRGVPCRAETAAAAQLVAVIDGRRVATVVDETGAERTRDWALLFAVGIVTDPPADGAAGADILDAERLRSWTRKLAKAAGLPLPTGDAPQDVISLGRAAAVLLEDLGWSERARVLVDGDDLAALLRDPETESLDPHERRALAYLAWVEGLRPFPDGRFRPQRPATQARLAAALVRIGESYRAFGLNDAVVSGKSPGGLRLVRGKGSIALSVAPDVALFGLSGGRATATERLDLWPGDRVRYRTGRDGKIDFLELRPPVKGTADDRSGRLYSWEVRKSRRALEAAVNRRVAVGVLKDLQIVRRGVSGRIVELRVVGSRGNAVVRGFDVRRLLDLRESLLVIEPQRNGDGEIEAVVFAGKGWGHGVGLCQVGAYGMALRGAKYREILSHYYSGARIEQLNTRRP